MRNLHIGDVITFRIQGIPVDARISSIRTRTRASLQPFFYFVFQDEVLKDAPQTLFTALRVEKDRIAELQNRIVARFPNVSVIDVTQTVSVFARIMSRLSAIVTFFTLFSVAAGLLIIVSSVFATRYTRIQEAVFFTILGGRTRFIRAVFGMENLVIGLTSSLIALTLAQTASWIICRKALDIPYAPFAGLSLLMALAATLLVLAAGLGASVPVFRKKPAAFFAGAGGGIIINDVTQIAVLMPCSLIAWKGVSDEKKVPRGIAIILLIVILAACEKQNHAAPQSLQQQQQFEGTIVAVGDSLTAGLGVNEEDAYPSLLQKKLQAAGISLEGRERRHQRRDKQRRSLTSQLDPEAQAPTS